MTDVRVVVSGLGVKSPSGNTVEDAYATVMSGKPQATHLPELMDAGVPVTFGCPVPEFDLTRYFSTVERRHFDHVTRLAVAAACDAVADARLTAAEPARSGVW